MMPPPGALLRALRPRQWFKNALVAAAPIAAGALDEGEVALRTLGAVLAFILAAGCTYLFNDAADVEVDRLHPTKRHRPVATGQITPAVAGRTSVVLGVTAVALAFVLAWAFGLVIVIYLLINAAYSAGLKHWPWIELSAVASGFILRAVGGGAATDIPLSAWFIVVVCAVAVIAVAGKRSAELRRTAQLATGRMVLSHYSVTTLRLTRAVAAATAVVAYALWVVTQDLANDWLAAVSMVPFAGAIAEYSRAIESGLGEDPEDIALRDRRFQLLTLAWMVSYGLAVYV